MPKNPHIRTAASKWRASIARGGAVTVFYAPTRPALYRAVMAWVGGWTGLALNPELQHPKFRGADDTALARTAHVFWCKLVVGDMLWRTAKRFDRRPGRARIGRIEREEGHGVRIEAQRLAPETED